MGNQMDCDYLQCKTDAECEAQVDPNSKCLFASTKVNACTCKDNYVLDESAQACVAVSGPTTTPKPSSAAGEVKLTSTRSWINLAIVGLVTVMIFK